VPAAAISAERAAEIVRALAREPRPAGGDAEVRARTLCAERLRAAGFAVREEAFEYSSFVGRWGTPIGGVVSLAIIVAAWALARHDRATDALWVLVMGAIVLAVAARVAARTGVLTFPAARRHSVNLVATRGAESPQLWLTAHLDSKSQPVPILVRAAGITLLGGSWLASIALAAATVAGWALPAWWAFAGAAAVAGAIPVIATTVGSRSPGALDNASGVAAVLVAAETTRGPVGVCLTSAEELGLAGARAWVRGRPAAIAVNCDGIDDGGTMTCMHSGERPAGLVAAVANAAKACGVPVRAHRLLPGVLTDGVALADAGWDVVTLSKGGIGTLARIHTSRDGAERLDGTGIAEVARVLSALVEAAISHQPSAISHQLTTNYAVRGQ